MINEPKTKEKRFQILSLDGGGIKGIFSAAVLAQIEETHKVNIVDHFDLIAGTSTGGIIAIALGLGIRPKEILNMYLTHGKNIFSWPRMRFLNHFFVRKFSRDGLKEALGQNFKEKTFGDSSKRLIIPSYSLSKNDIYLFRTSHAAHLLHDYSVKASDVAMATAAAPTYFSKFKGPGGNRLIDGGVWANNPIMVALAEAVGFLNADIKNTYALSIGTTLPIKVHPNYLNWGGLLLWASTAPDVIMAGQSIAANNQAKIFLGKDNLVRINSIVTKNEFGLDKANYDELIAKAAHELRIESGNIKNLFLSHKAEEFTPINK